MSDTVKLIIEIPEELYSRIKDGGGWTCLNTCRECIENGIPLDEVKAEIENQKGKWDDTSSDTCFNMVLEIIDKHISDKGDKE